jgi:magnesium chelatase family protein
MVCKIITSSIIGLDAYKVDVEVDLVSSLPNIVIVGLPDTSVNEAKDRVRSAIKNSSLSFPYSKKVIINLAPADIKKEGTNFDLPIAIGILVENEVIDEHLIKDMAFIGELSLDGTLRGVNGILSHILCLKKSGIKYVIVPEENSKEASLVNDITIYSASNLNEVVNHFTENPLPIVKTNAEEYLINNSTNEYSDDFKNVKGQKKAKKALEIAAAGGHNVIMTGSPGAGKTLMAKCFASILPPLELSEALELTKIYSVAGLLHNKPLITQRPFRSVHHTASASGITGGGSNPKPGEITLAHRGVLFLDEVVEFPRNVLEVLRQPLEDGEVVISRAKHSVKYPADFILLAAMNPCPCGFLGDTEKQCTCSDYQINRYKSRISGPLMDRIDIQINVPRLTTEELIDTDKTAETSQQIRTRVINARNIQKERYKAYGILTNSQLHGDLIKKFCNIDEQSKEILKIASIKYKLSGRRYDRVLKLARTIADLDNSEKILSTHLTQALQYRLSEEYS